MPSSPFTSRPFPRQVFDDPQAAWDFLTQPTDDGFEGQHFDRKEAGRLKGGISLSKSDLEGVKELIIKTVSAFANSNVEGGLLVLGISSKGDVCGIDHLSEGERNSITNLDALLRTHAAEVKCHHCQDADGVDKTLCLIYSAYVPNAICETPGVSPKAWVRHGPQSLLMNQEIRDRVRLRKGLLNIDSLPCCPFSLDDLDTEVMREFRRVFHPESTAEFTDERLLYEAGAIVKNNGETSFTLPGLLFFAVNPQRVLPHTYLRLLKFVVPSNQFRNRGTPSFDKDFRGPITKQIRAVRIFLRETSFFERLQYRKSDGGFSEQPELPTIAVDEAIVNAVAHRDYYTRNPIYCEHYADAFVVKNPGRMRQQNVDLPDRFNLSTTPLDSMPLNRRLLEWLRLMKDPEGNAFVQALSEGTKRMTREMVALDLPPPSVVLLENETILKLESRAKERKDAFLASIQVPKTAFMNIYPLTVSKGSGPVTSGEVHLRLGEFSKALRDSLAAHGWYIDRFSFSRIVAHRTGADLPVPTAARKVLRFFPAYCIQLHELFGRLYLTVDYTCQVLSILKAHEVSRHLGSGNLVGRGCVAQQGAWRSGKIVSAADEWITVHFFDNEEEKQVQVNRVIPKLSLTQIETILQAQLIAFDFHGTIKKHGLASEPTAARKRAEKIQATAENLADEVFPVVFGEFEARMVAKAVSLSEFEPRSESTFHVERLSEPAVEFRDHQKLPDVREGITRYGSYESDPHTIELVPICLVQQRHEMESLIERLKAGKYKYRGAERTFATRFNYSTVMTVEALEGLDREASRLLSEHPDWSGNERLNRLFLVHTPEAGYSTDDETSPYFVVKRRLLEAGVPCQMVDTGTLHNPDWKDLNLSLNIIAKCGITPWVLPENIPDADFFIGLSYTQSRDGQKILGFANVFSSYGKWEFYAGNTTSFDVRKRSEHLAALARSALERLKFDHSLPAGPNLVFHHSVRISKDDYAAILSGVRSIAPDASVSFVWVNAHNNFRLFDSRVEMDGSIQRGSFVPISRRRVLLSTTGYNAYRKSLGTPRPLEVSADHYRPGATVPVECEARTLALQVLNLTKLNWASTDSFTAEPITIKYAGDIAYLTAAFLRQREPFQLHRVLERTPWFM
jgi:predicted HTH transcriptional regulator